jgi:hypothetical protein
MGKSLRDYITESEQWIDNPVPGDDFAINFREECLVESYVLETRKNAVVIQADETMIRIMESYGCSMEDLDEEQSVDDVLVSEDPTEEEPTAPGTMGAVDEPTDYDPIGEDFMGRMLELAGCGRKTMEGDISQIEKDIADAPVAPMGTIEEGMMSEIDIDLHALASRGDEEDLIAALEGDLGPGTAVVLQNMMDELKDELAAKGMNDVINDNDKMIEILWDKIVDEYSDGDFDTEEMSEAEYQGRKVPLGKPMRGDVKKFKVYVRDPKTGNVKKVNFGHGGTSAKRAGQKTMKIKKSDPARRRSFRARHNCDNPGPRTKARYWACRAW